MGLVCDGASNDPLLLNLFTIGPKPSVVVERRTATTATPTPLDQSFRRGQQGVMPVMPLTLYWAQAFNESSKASCHSLYTRPKPSATVARRIATTATHSLPGLILQCW